MAAKHRSPPISAARKPGPSPDPGGVVATIERLTGITPCPTDLRNCANKYLRSESLFPTPRGEQVSNREKLIEEDAQTLLMNALALDEIFRGDTTLVIRVLLNEVNPDVLKKDCRTATREMEQRVQIYAYWQQRMAAVESLLCGNFDPKKDRIDKKSHPVDIIPNIPVPAPCALRAVRTLERIEQGRWQQGVRASDLLQQADAYLVLGDFDAAAFRARRAIALEPGNAHAWFIHIVALLKQRNHALSQMQRHRLEATEFADPMSAHERSAYDAAGEEASTASRVQESLDLVVPEALLNWPAGPGGQHEHPEWRRLVVDLMLSQAFRKIRIGGDLGESRRDFELNGFAKEWQLKLDAPELPRAAGEQPASKRRSLRCVKRSVTHCRSFLPNMRRIGRPLLI